MLLGKTRVPAIEIRNPLLVRRHVTAVVLAAFFRAFPGRFRTVAAAIGDWEVRTWLADLQAFIQDHHAELEAELQAIVPPELWPRLQPWEDGVAGPESRLAMRWRRW